MLYAFGFERVGVMVSDLYFLDPTPNLNQEGAERGVRLELRALERASLKGSIYSAQPIGVDRPLWRVDLLESVASAPGSFDRTHHHPTFNGWEPCKRNFVPELSADPLGWLGQRLSDIGQVLDDGGEGRAVLGPNDAADIRAAAQEIVEATSKLLRRVHAGDLAAPPPDVVLQDARIGWL